MIDSTSSFHEIPLGPPASRALAEVTRVAAALPDERRQSFFEAVRLMVARDAKSLFEVVRLPALGTDGLLFSVDLSEDFHALVASAAEDVETAAHGWRLAAQR